MSKLIIGLTGGIGSGKTTVSNLFSDKGIDIIDADLIARDVVAPKSEALLSIKQHFGSEVILESGQLNRPFLRKLIFSCEDNKRWLNNLLHPLIRTKIIENTHSANSEYCLLVAPLLIENSLLSLVNRVLVVDVNESTQLERTLIRDDSSSRQEVKSIMKSQIDREQRLQAADDIINNDNPDLTALASEVNNLHHKYLAMVKKMNK
jgi:dephospho-CoA kinase